MVAHYNAAFITLHVRKSNRAAISLYRDALGFEVHTMEKGYCECASRLCGISYAAGLELTSDADGEDAYGMRFVFKGKDAAA
jgi:peptide alpha-N-acetyltransferase